MVKSISLQWGTPLTSNFCLGILIRMAETMLFQTLCLWFFLTCSLHPLLRSKSRSEHSPWVLLLPPSLSFISTSPNKILACLILSWHRSLWTSKWTYLPCLPCFCSLPPNSGYYSGDWEDPYRPGLTFTGALWDSGSTLCHFLQHLAQLLGFQPS